MQLGALAVLARAFHPSEDCVKTGTNEKPAQMKTGVVSRQYGGFETFGIKKSVGENQ